MYNNNEYYGNIVQVDKLKTLVKYKQIIALNDFLPCVQNSKHKQGVHMYIYNRTSQNGLVYS